MFVYTYMFEGLRFSGVAGRASTDDVTRVCCRDKVTCECDEEDINDDDDAAAGWFWTRWARPSLSRSRSLSLSLTHTHIAL